MTREPGSIHRPDPVALLLTWTTYGSWLPGDARGWVDGNGMRHDGNEHLHRVARRAMRHVPVTLVETQREIVESAIRDECRHRGWLVHALNCRTNHVHVVGAVVRQPPHAVMRCFKATSSRRLSRHCGPSRRWWTRGGSVRWLFDAPSLERAIVYVMDGQHIPRR